MQESGIDQAVQQAMANPYWNPRELEQNEIRSLISHAFHGHAPT
jgi:alcohol dehydrogenase class IV